MNEKKKKIYLTIIYVIFAITAFPAIYNYYCYKVDNQDEYEKNDLPKLYIKGDVLQLASKEEKLNVTVKYKSKDINFQSYATIKLQGQTSIFYPKKNYNITFYEDKELESKKGIDFKWGNFDKYTLKADWMDKTHSRNIVASDIAGNIYNKYGYFTNTPTNGVIDGFPIEIFINNKYHGLYTLNLNKDFMFEETDKKYTLISNQTEYGMKTLKEETLEWENFEVEVGEENQETLDQFNRLLNFIQTSADDEFKRDIEEYIDLDSILNYYCYVRFAELWDNLGKNLYFLTYDGKVWYTVFYDLNLSYQIDKIEGKDEKNVQNHTNIIPLWSKLERNFGPELSKRYNELRQDVLTKENVIEKFQTFTDSIPKEAYENDNEKWQNHLSITDSISEFVDYSIEINDNYFNSLQ